MLVLTSVFCLIATVVGGIPFGYLVGRLVLKDDIRLHGSGNIGATNVARVLGWKWGGLVLFLDAMKGLGPTLAAKLFLPSSIAADSVQFAVILTGICAIVGHMYPIWLRLRGGKGVATALGVVLVISPMATGVAFLLFVVAIAATRIVALSSIIAAIGFAVTQFTLLGKTALNVQNLPLAVFSVIVPLLIIWRHRSNIVRLWRGEEKKISSRSNASPLSDAKP